MSRQGGRGGGQVVMDVERGQVILSCKTLKSMVDMKKDTQISLEVKCRITGGEGGQFRSIILQNCAILDISITSIICRCTSRHQHFSIIIVFFAFFWLYKRQYIVQFESQ